MKIHADLLPGDIGSCVPTGTRIVDFSEARSRSHDRAYVARLSGSSRGTMRGLPHKAATWDEWGKFIAALFKLDPNAKIGPYKDEADFNRKTDHRYQVWL